MSKFYTFGQNNSGGSFLSDHAVGVSKYVIVEADSSAEANERAESIGLYFDGTDGGPDCPCCGDRWYRVGPNEGEDAPMIYGKGVRLRDGDPIAEVGCYEGYVHPKAGNFYAVVCQ